MGTFLPENVLKLNKVKNSSPRIEMLTAFTLAQTVITFLTHSCTPVVEIWVVCTSAICKPPTSDLTVTLKTLKVICSVRVIILSLPAKAPYHSKLFVIRAKIKPEHWSQYRLCEVSPV